MTTIVQRQLRPRSPIGWAVNSRTPGLAGWELSITECCWENSGRPGCRRKPEDSARLCPKKRKVRSWPEWPVSTAEGEGHDGREGTRESHWVTVGGFTLLTNAEAREARGGPPGTRGS